MFYLKNTYQNKVLSILMYLSICLRVIILNGNLLKLIVCIPYHFNDQQNMTMTVKVNDHCLLKVRITIKYTYISLNGFNGICLKYGFV